MAVPVLYTVRNKIICTVVIDLTRLIDKFDFYFYILLEMSFVNIKSLKSRILKYQKYLKSK